jgi:hypothetical protein
MPPLLRLARRLRYLGEPLHRPLMLDRAWPTRAACWDMAEHRLAEMSRPYLAFAIRSDLSIRPRAARTWAVIEALVRRPLASQLRFTDGAGVLRTLGLASDPLIPARLSVPAASTIRAE